MLHAPRARIAMRAAELGDPQRAECVLAVSADDALACANLGFLLVERDALVDAEACFRRVVDLDTRLERAWYGMCLRKQGRPVEAVRPFEECIRLSPHSPNAGYQLAHANHHLGRPEESRSIIERLETFEPRCAARLRRELETGAA